MCTKFRRLQPYPALSNQPMVVPPAAVVKPEGNGPEVRLGSAEDNCGVGGNDRIVCAGGAQGCARRCFAMRVGKFLARVPTTCERFGKLIDKDSWKSLVAPYPWTRRVTRKSWQDAKASKQ